MAAGGVQLVHVEQLARQQVGDDEHGSDKRETWLIPLIGTAEGTETYRTEQTRTSLELRGQPRVVMEEQR